MVDFDFEIDDGVFLIFLLGYTRPFPAKYLAIRDYWKRYSTYDKFLVH